MVALLVKETGWSIEYIMDLTLKQLELLFSGFNVLSSKQSKGAGAAVEQLSSEDGLGIIELMMSQKDKAGKSVFKMTDKAKKAIKKIYVERVEKSKGKM